MKKSLLTLVIVMLSITYVYYSFSDETVSQEADDMPQPESLVPVTEEVVFEFSDRVFATERLKELTIANAQCKENGLEFGDQVQNILGILVDTLEHELRNGKSERELLAYDDQFETYYSDFDDLLLRAKLNIQREKYAYSTRAEMLNEWHGVSVVNGLDAINTPLAIEALKKLGEMRGLSMSLKLRDDIQAQDVLALLQNDEIFNTYLVSPLNIEGMPLSPSTLFVLTAPNVDVQQFEQAVSLQSYTVNDVAVAIKANIPFEYIQLLVEQTSSIEDMPTVLQGTFESYANLADLAAANHNVEVLEVLESYGVRPSNEPGIITGLDLAIMNLPDTADAYPNLDSFPDKYHETLRYLINKGYRAHGSPYNDGERDGVMFRAPNRRITDSNSWALSLLQDVIGEIELLDSSHHIEQIPKDTSLISRAIETITIKKNTLQSSSANCESIRQDLLAEEGFADSDEKYQLIQRYEQGEKSVQALHDIDPALVNASGTLQPQTPDEQTGTARFTTLLQEQKYDLALSYSATHPLTEQETNKLLSTLVFNTAESFDIWQARVNHTPPSGLMAFTHLPLEKWAWLVREGFDFSVQDKWGNDFFAPAALHSPEAVQLLMEAGYSANFDNLGLDVLDILLEDSYAKGRLNPSIGLLLSSINTLEPNHFARIERLRVFFPDEYQALINLDDKAVPPVGTQINRFRNRNI